MTVRRIICISDTHNRHAELALPEGDVLIHSGDFTMHGTAEETRAFAEWFLDQSHPHKILVAGNHEHLFEKEPDTARALLPGVHYLQDSGVDLDGVHFWGSPWQPEYGGWAFNLPKGEALARKWRQVPSGLDVLITHVPPSGVMDLITNGIAIGCEALHSELRRIRPHLHAFGHAHESRGVQQTGGWLSINAAICDEHYHVMHQPVIVECNRDAYRAID
jgi:hypothetical protein